MQKALSELVDLPDAELNRLVEREPVLITQNGDPQFVAQSLDAFEASPNSDSQRHRGKLILLRS